MSSSYIKDANEYYREYRDHFRQVIIDQTQKANIVLTDPGERAIALQCGGQNLTPKIIAKGDLDLARLIYKIAGKNKIRIAENKKLTNELFEKTDIGNYAPAEYWEDIAAIVTNKNISVSPSVLNNDLNIMPYDSISVELGYGLVPLAEIEKGGNLAERIAEVRKILLFEYGMAIPAVRIVDNVMLDDNEYCININGVRTGSSKIIPGSLLCINPGNAKYEIAGEKTQDPAFGISAVWINAEDKENAVNGGYTVIDHVCIISTHLTEICRKHMPEFLGMQKVMEMLEELRNDYPAVTNEILKALSISQIQKVLKNLLNEEVSIRNIVRIMEALAEYAPVTKDLWYLTEKARQALADQICGKYCDDKRRLRVLVIDMESNLESKILEMKHETASDIKSVLDPVTQKEWIKTLNREIVMMKRNGYAPVLLCSEAARPLVKDSTRFEIPDLAVISVCEIGAGYSVECTGVIRINVDSGK